MYYCFFAISFATAGIWKENFDDRMPKGWETVVGKWKVDKKALTETADEPYCKIMFGDVAWKDYSVAVDITIGEGKHPCNCTDLLVRADKEGENGYRFWIRTASIRPKFLVGSTISLNTDKRQYLQRLNQVKLIA